MNEMQAKLEKLFNSLKTSSKDDVFYLYLEIGNLLFDDKYYQEGAEYLIKSLPYFKHQNKEELHIQTLEKIIEGLLFVKDEEALKYIYLHKEAIPITKEEKYLLNIINYNKTFDRPYLHLIDDLKGINVNNDTLVELLLERIDKTTELEKIQEDINYLKTIAKEEVLVNLYDLELKILYENNKITELKNLLRDDILAVFYNILFNISDDNFKIVQQLETEHEEEFKKLSLINQEKLYLSIIDYYENYDPKSKIHYENKLRQVRKLLKKVKKDITHELVIPEIAEKAPLIELSKEIKIQSDQVFYLFEKMFEQLSQIPYKNDSHENLRTKLVAINDNFSFSDCLICLNKKIYHFKKTRLYEKTYSKDLIDQSIIGITLKLKEDIVFNVGESKYNYDLLTNNTFESSNLKQIYSYYLNNNNAIVFYQDKKLSLYKEDIKFKLLSSWLSYEVIQSGFLVKKEKQEKLYYNFFSNNSLVAFYLEDNYIYGNNTFKTLFKTTNKTTIDSFLLSLDAEDRLKFKTEYEKILAGSLKTTFEFNYQDKTYLVNLINNDVIYGVLFDITYKENELTIVKHRASYNSFSNKQTLVKFKETFLNKINEKQTVLLISLKNSELIENIYGKEEVIKELINLLPSFEDSLVYEYDGSSFIVLLDFNDIRTVNKYLNNLENKEKFNIGILRYPIETSERDVNKILTYLSLAHYHAKLVSEGHFFFKYEVYQKDKYESEILKQIERLIESNQLKLNFSQIINLENNKVYSYLVNLYDESLLIESSYYEYVAKVKNKLPYLEKYMLKETFKAFKTIYDETNKYLRLTIIINEETVKEKTFNAFLIALFKQYEVPHNLIDIIIKGSNYKNVYLNLEELTNLGINIGTNNYDYLNLNSTKVFYYQNKINLYNDKEIIFIENLNNYAKKTNTKLIFDNVDSKDVTDKLKKLQISYTIGGKNYKKWTFTELLKFIRAF